MSTSPYVAWRGRVGEATYRVVVVPGRATATYEAMHVDSLGREAWSDASDFLSYEDVDAIVLAMARELGQRPREESAKSSDPTTPVG